MTLNEREYIYIYKYIYIYLFIYLLDMHLTPLQRRRHATMPRKEKKGKKAVNNLSKNEKKLKSIKSHKTRKGNLTKHKKGKIKNVVPCDLNEGQIIHLSKNESEDSDVNIDDDLEIESKDSGFNKEEKHMRH